MRHRTNDVMPLGVLALFAWSATTAAHAESFVPSDTGPPCGYGSPEVDPPAGPVPQNWPAFLIALHGVDASTTRMTRVSDAHVVPLRIDTRSGAIQFVPTEMLVVGESYLVEHPRCLAMPAHTTLYDVVAPITEPSDVGTIEVQGPFASNVQHGACHRHYFVDVVLTPDPAYASAPWSSFQWGVGVDGADVRFGAAITSTHRRIGIDCSPGEPWFDPTVREGSHSVVVRTWQRDAADLTVRESAGVAFAPLCADAVRVDDATLRPLDATEIAAWDEDLDGSCAPDAALDPDASVSMDAAVRDATADGGAHTEPDTTPNCACGVGRGAFSATPWMLLAGLLIARRVRRAATTARS